MSTSTPKSKGFAKLYGYLDGYETACFTGLDKSSVIKSVSEMIHDEALILDLSKSCVREIDESVTSKIDRFLSKYYERMRKISTPEKVADLAEKSKKDYEVLQKVLSLAIQGATTPIDCLGYGTLQSGGSVASVYDICVKCPYYIGSRFCIIYSPLDDEEGLNGELFRISVPEYRLLVSALLRLMHILLKHGVDINNLLDYYMLFNHILTPAKIFECMNPSGSARKKQLESTIEMLKSESLNVQDPKYQTYLEVLRSVFSDIREGKKRYIQDIRRSLDSNDAFIHSKYDNVRDVYLSMKGTAQSTRTKRYHSLFSSPYEVDLYYKEFQEFDDFVGYKSPYKKPESLSSEEREAVMCIRTIIINNPGKFKGRIIHIFDNPLQDRVNYIQRRVAKLLYDMRCDCTHNQDIGREFLKQKTLEWYAQKDFSKRIGIYGFDFSNATDTLDQNFQQEVLEFVFGPEIARFWTQVSRLPKYYNDSITGNAHWVRYEQHRGQPQGALGSFPSFALAHHFIFLMDMKLLGFENCDPKRFYRVLGDDSVCNSIDGELDFFDRNNCFIDEEGIARSSIEELHMDICKHFAGFEVNYSKSNAVHYDSDEAKSEFAKVTYRNGKFFSPVPFRLAMTYSKHNSSRIAVAIWRGERSEENSSSFMDRVLHHINNDELSDIVHSGAIPYLDKFKDNRSYNASWLARLRYSYTVSTLMNGISSIWMKDHERDWATTDTFIESLRKLYGRQFRKEFSDLDDVNPEHKIFMVMAENQTVLNELKAVFANESIDDRMLCLVTSPLFHNDYKQGFEDQLFDLAESVRLLNLAKENPEFDISQIFPDFDFSYKKDVMHLSNSFLTRGITRRPAEESGILENTLNVLTELSEILGPVDRVA